MNEIETLRKNSCPCPQRGDGADSTAPSLRLMGDTAWHVYKHEYFSL